jgi:hypothetical protein
MNKYIITNLSLITITNNTFYSAQLLYMLDIFFAPLHFENIVVTNNNFFTYFEEISLWLEDSETYLFKLLLPVCLI